MTAHQSPPLYARSVSDPVDAPDGVAALLSDAFPPTTGQRRYMLLDGGTLPNLPERLAALGIEGRSIYDETIDPDLLDVSPRLVPLPVDATDGAAEETQPDLMTDWCRPSRDGADPFALLDRRPGILILSPLAPADLRARLRRLVLLPDEGGVRVWLRFQEPGVLDALLRACRPAAQSGILAGMSRIIWSEPALEDDLWRLRAIDAAPVGEDAPRACLPILDAPVRQALAHAVHRHRARAVARAEGGTLDDRLSVAATVVRLLDLGHGGPDWLLVHFHRLLMRAPADWQAWWWSRAESGDESLAVLNRAMHDRHGTGEFAP